jgi:hypothetical protein
MQRPALHSRIVKADSLPVFLLTTPECQVLACLWRTVISPSQMWHTALLRRFPYVIDSKRALSFGEVPLRIYLCAQPQNACVRSCYPMRQNPQKCCLPCRLGTIIDFRVSGRHFAPALAKRSVRQTPHCLAARGEHTASKKLTLFALRFRTEIHHFAWRLLLKCRFWRKLYRLEGLLKRCFLGEVLFLARTALCKI